jgi:flagellar biosynthesis/type III secretory pathway protein FliH
VESIIQDPNVQELINEWKDKGRAEGRAKGLAKGLAEGRAEGLAKGRAKGRAAEARLLLHKVLAARSFRVTPKVRARIDSEPDVARIESWLEAAVTARAVGDVFRDR